MLARLFVKLFAVLLTVLPVKDVRKTVAVAPSSTVFIEAGTGSVDVAGWDRAEVEVRARIEPPLTLWGAAAERACVERTDVYLDPGPASVRIGSRYRSPRGFLATLLDSCGGGARVHYRVRVPPRG
jgi:hypothetical protein